MRLPSNSRNFTIPSRFCVCGVEVGGIVCGEVPFVSGVDIVVLTVSPGSVLCKMRWCVAACLNSLFNWNNEKFRRLFVTNLKTLSMFQLYSGIECVVRIFFYLCFSSVVWLSWLMFSLALDYCRWLSLTCSQPNVRTDFSLSRLLFVQLNFFAVMLTQMFSIALSVFSSNALTHNTNNTHKINLPNELLVVSVRKSLFPCRVQYDSNLCFTNAPVQCRRRFACMYSDSIIWFL